MKTLTLLEDRLISSMFLTICCLAEEAVQRNWDLLVTERKVIIGSGKPGYKLGRSGNLGAKCRRKDVILLNHLSQESSEFVNLSPTQSHCGDFLSEFAFRIKPLILAARRYYATKAIDEAS